MLANAAESRQERKEIIEAIIGVALIALMIGGYFYLVAPKMYQL